MGYCTLVGGNLPTWKTKTQAIVAQLSSKAKYQPMAHGICELMWLKILLQELGFTHKGSNGNTL